LVPWVVLALQTQEVVVVAVPLTVVVKVVLA
jgi:hypothetical protein